MTRKNNKKVTNKKADLNKAKTAESVRHNLSHAIDTGEKKRDASQTVINRVFGLRKNFLIIGLTGRTGSGCSTVARTMSCEWDVLKSNYHDLNSGVITNETRKDRIVYRFLKKHWESFKVISASDIIFYYALKEDFDVFVESLSKESNEPDEKSKVNNNSPNTNEEIKRELRKLQQEFELCHNKVLEVEKDIENADIFTEKEKIDALQSLIFVEIKKFRQLLDSLLANTKKKIISQDLQRWGNNIRKYNSIKDGTESDIDPKTPSCLARKINQIIKALRTYNKKTGTHTLIVIDALRNPFEILYFRERYAAFYLMAVHTDEKIRHNTLYQKGYRNDEIEKLDKVEDSKKLFRDSYEKIDLDKCIELADIHITHENSDGMSDRNLVNQIFTYIALIFHPGLIPPSPQERVMQVAYTAKLNSGCLSRQVGAVVTNKNYSVLSIGWNTVPEGQTPCTLRSLFDLDNEEDDNAYSNFERCNSKFKEQCKKLINEYKSASESCENCGVNLSYCFKDIYTSYAEKQRYNQVHTRSLHAEENAFLQLAKYGTLGIAGGRLFTTASCCELCAKKAYQLGITEIYYIDSYPGISRAHILESGTIRPKFILFKGVIGRAYINLYTPFLPIKDEIAELTGVDVKAVINPEVKG